MLAAVAGILASKGAVETLSPAALVPVLLSDSPNTFRLTAIQLMPVGVSHSLNALVGQEIHGLPVGINRTGS